MNAQASSSAHVCIRYARRLPAVIMALLLAAAPLLAQQELDADRLRAELSLRPSYLEQPVRLLIVGTYHFANPGQDVVNAQVDDVRSPQRQGEIEQVLDALAAFRPTVVAVERVPAMDSALQARYAAIRAGEPASPSETEQIGLRLAARLGHARVHPVDHRMPLDLQSVFERGAQTDPEFAARLEPVFGAIGAMMQAMVDDRTIGQALRVMNDPALGDVGHATYMDMVAVGTADEPVGAEVIADWYERNLHIFANLARVARPGDRVVLVIGAGHEPLIRHYAEMTTGWQVELLADWLRP